MLGFDALGTGIGMSPISITMFVTSASGPALAVLSLRFTVDLPGREDDDPATDVPIPDGSA